MDLRAGGEGANEDVVIVTGEHEEGRVQRDVHVQNWSGENDLIEHAEVGQTRDVHNAIRTARGEHIVVCVHADLGDHRTMQVQFGNEVAGVQQVHANRAGLRAGQDELLVVCEGAAHNAAAL